MNSVTGLEFSYTQAPSSMKSVVSSLWYLTVCFGNIIDVFLVESKFASTLVNHIGWTICSDNLFENWFNNLFRKIINYFFYIISRMNITLWPDWWQWLLWASFWSQSTFTNTSTTIISTNHWTRARQEKLFCQGNLFLSYNTNIHRKTFL